MIKITALNKIYRSKKRKHCHALKDVNLTLPDAGLVFVLGKSGSGKSTLLNLIGGLDNLSSGRIEVDGNDLSRFKERDFCNYRNTHIGFIFQDYHLIDELTVYENIVFSLNLRRIEDEGLVKAALERVGLAGYEERYPTELSGGEQQRVAIARAIVKRPRIILADEPTGNLDTHTARSIVELLRELARDCLILIVSHNVNDANAYADRIIELAAGQIVADRTRNPDFADRVLLMDDKLIYPEGLALDEQDIELINRHPNKAFVLRRDKFLKTQEKDVPAKKIKIENKSLSPRRELSFSAKFLKSKGLAISLASFMVAVIMVIMALAQTIVSFDGSHIVAAEMAKSQQTAILMNKTVSKELSAKLPGQYMVTVGEGDAQAFYDAGYNGKIYPVLNHSLATVHIGTSWGVINARYKGVYLTETFGTMIVDEAFLQRKFGDYEYAARLDQFQDCGVIITDYVADSIIALNSKYTQKTYDELLGEYFFPTFSHPRCYINGIIDTGYKDRYKDLLEEIRSSKSQSTSELYSDPEFQMLMNEITTLLCYCYTTNPDFKEDYLGTSLAAFPPHYTLVFNDVLEYRTMHYPYVINSTGQITHLDTTHLLARDWMYTDEAPAIPEGAKYIRVAFNNNVDSTYGCDHPIAKAECATLVFNNGEPIPAEVMNALTRKEKGLVIDRYTGEVIPHERGGASTLISDYIEIPENAEITEFTAIALAGEPLCAFYDENKELISCVNAPKGRVLEEKTVYFSMNKYNDIFGTEYTNETADSFVPHKVTMTHYDYNDADRTNPLFSVEITIAGFLEAGASRTMDVSQDIYELFAKDYLRVYSLYLDGTDGIGHALDAAGELYYEPQSISVDGIHTMTRAVDVFVPLFEFISIFLYIGVIFILMNFASKMINGKMHEIGIMKALGTKNTSIGAVFGLQVGLIALLTCILSTVGYYFFIDMANEILIDSIRRIAPGHTLPDLQFLIFKPAIAVMNCLLVFALAFVSFLLPMIKIKAIKPVKIIKAKE